MQYAAVGILELLQLTHNIASEENFNQLYGMASILSLSTQFHVVYSCMTDPCALAAAGQRSQAEGVCPTC